MRLRERSKDLTRVTPYDSLFPFLRPKPGMHAVQDQKLTPRDFVSGASYVKLFRR